ARLRIWTFKWFLHEAEGSGRAANGTGSRANHRGSVSSVGDELPVSGSGERAPRPVERAMRRVAITGLGVVGPNGIGKEAFWDACVNGRSGVRPIRSFDASAHPVRIAAEVPDFDMAPFLPGAHRKSLKIMGRAARFGVAAATLAVRDSGLDLAK